MPAEKFYPPTAIDGAPSDRLEVGWHKEYDGVHLTMILDDGTKPRVSAIPLDRAGLNRLIKTLRKARNQTYGADE